MQMVVLLIFLLIIFTNYETSTFESWPVVCENIKNPIIAFGLMQGPKSERKISEISAKLEIHNEFGFRFLDFWWRNAGAGIPKIPKLAIGKEIEFEFRFYALVWWL